MLGLRVAHQQRRVLRARVARTRVRVYAALALTEVARQVVHVPADGGNGRLFVIQHVAESVCEGVASAEGTAGARRRAGGGSVVGQPVWRQGLELRREDVVLSDQGDVVAVWGD